jgi:hypothetical protein
MNASGDTRQIPHCEACVMLPKVRSDQRQGDGDDRQADLDYNRMSQSAESEDF